MRSMSKMKKKTCALAEKALSVGDASARAPRVSDSFAAADVRDGVAEVHVVKHLEENHELEHDEKAEPARADVRAGEPARAARMRERGPRAGKVAPQKRPAHPS